MTNTIDPSTNSHSNSHPPIPPRLFSTSNNTSSLESFKTLITNSKPTHYPLATTIDSNIPIYTLPAFSSLSPPQRSALQDEWHHILLSGPGIFVTENLYPDVSLLSRVTDIFTSIIAAEEEEAAASGKNENGSRGDHFAAPGTNSRLWNSFSKHGIHDPKSFLAYYSNPWIPLIASSWLGPAHRLTAQVNIVKPGGKAQVPHRDYHLGFQSDEAVRSFPRGAHLASQFLTLQGAIAHSDMPAESGPTRVLPFSQLFEEGYIAFRDPSFQKFFSSRYVALPLSRGSGLFFNPALFHAAGCNDSADIMRVANLLQISSAFGKPMESVDTEVLVEKTWGVLRGKYEAEGESEEVRAFVGNVGEGYPFPTNLDRRVPGEGEMAPESEQEVLLRGLREGWEVERVVGKMRRMREDGRA